MPVGGSFYEFNEANISRAPDGPGVYALFEGAETIYIGMSTVSIRDRLTAHLNGTEGRCTQGASHYKRQETTADQAEPYEEALLAEYQAAYGRLPRCNRRAS